MSIKVQLIEEKLMICQATEKVVLTSLFRHGQASRSAKMWKGRLWFQLDENILEVSWTAWKNRFDRWQLFCKISDNAVVNRNLEAIPNQLADQIWVGLAGTESKEVLLAKIKEAVVKKRSVFLYRKYLHQIVQNRAEDPERYAAIIRQSAPPCCPKTNNKSSDYSANLMS